MATGRIERIFEDRGYGFIRPRHDGENVFFHAYQLRGGLVFGVGLQDRRVTFEIEQSERGPRARNVHPAD